MIGALRVLGLFAATAMLVAACSTSTSGQGSLASGAASAPGPTGPTAVGGSSATPAGASSTAATDARSAAFTDPAVVAQILADTRHDLATANTYDYRHLHDALTAALAVTTGEYGKQFASTFDKVIAPDAGRVHARQTATFDRAGVVTVTAGRATVLAFGQLSVTNTTYPHGRTDPVAVGATVQLGGGHWLLAQLTEGGDVSGAPPGTAGLAAALSAARTGVTNLITFSRAHFEADYARAVDATTGSLRADVARRRTVIRAALETGGFDLVGKVDSVAAESAAGSRVVALVRVDGYHVTGGKQGTPTPQSLEVTVDRVSGRWLLSHLVSVGVH